MTKQEWLDCNDLEAMLKEVTSNRKKQLFALACCRSIEYLMQDQRSKDCLEKLELFIDGKISKEEFELARQTAWTVKLAADDAVYDADCTAEKDANVSDAIYYTAESIVMSNYAAYVAYRAARSIAIEGIGYHEMLLFDRDITDRVLRERFKQLELLRDIYNPFLLNLKFSDQAISLAEQVYEGDDSARNILSDCLEDEGYPVEIVMHLKSGFHPKGCWLIDQILEKS